MILVHVLWNGNWHKTVIVGHVFINKSLVSGLGKEQKRNFLSKKYVKLLFFLFMLKLKRDLIWYILSHYWRPIKENYT